jgi:anti-sigma regulatory factor (Ser/Thr protein kinase)/DNA-binding NarL/FixJ family response regulator
MSRVLIIGSDPSTQLIAKRLSAAEVPVEFVMGRVGALQCVRANSIGIVITCPSTSFEEDLALLHEMRLIRPAIKFIILAPTSTPEDVIAALRAHVFACCTPPFDIQEIADLAREAASSSLRGDDISVLSARPGWVAIRANCRLLTAERLMTFARELSNQIDDFRRYEVMQGLREILLNAMEHGAAFNPDQMIEVTAIRTQRSIVFYVRDPGAGFRTELIRTDVIANPGEDAIAFMHKQKKVEVQYSGGFGLLLARGTVDELLYSEIGNEALLIKYLDSPPPELDPIPVLLH